MARKAFFSFHHENDISRANIVRNSWVTKPNTESAGFIDAAEYEKIKKERNSVLDWIDRQLDGTSVTVVLIGTDTSNREFVKYELQKSYSRGNGLLGIYIHNIKNFQGMVSLKGSNQFGEIGKDGKGQPVYFSISYPSYDWILDDGYNNLGKWIEEAAKKAGK